MLDIFNEFIILEKKLFHCQSLISSNKTERIYFNLNYYYFLKNVWRGMYKERNIQKKIFSYISHYFQIIQALKMIQ